MNKPSVVRVSIGIKSVEMVDGTKVLGRIVTKDGRTYTLIKGDRVVIVRRKKIIQPK